MIFYVDVREKESGNIVTTVLETEEHDEAWEVVNEYNKEYGTGGKYLATYPKDKYFMDVFNDETR